MKNSIDLKLSYTQSNLTKKKKKFAWNSSSILIAAFNENYSDVLNGT